MSWIGGARSKFSASRGVLAPARGATIRDGWCPPPGPLQFDLIADAAKVADDPQTE